MKLCSVVVWLLAVLACGTTAAQTTTRDQVHWVPMRDKDGAEHRLFTRICRPAGDAPAPVVLINHGSPPDAGARPAMRPASCESEAVQWFLARGYLVVLGMRRGYGETGGPWAEDFGPGCGAEGYARAGLESARDLDALVTYATALPFARPDGVVVVGQSAGGWATVAYDSRPHPKVAAMVNMAGGRGGHQQQLANHNCRPDELARAAGLLRRHRLDPDALGVHRQRQLLCAADRNAGARGVCQIRRQGRPRAARPVRHRWPQLVLRSRRLGDLGTARREVSRRTRPGRLTIIAR